MQIDYFPQLRTNIIRDSITYDVFFSLCTRMCMSTEYIKTLANRLEESHKKGFPATSIQKWRVELKLLIKR